MKERGNSRKNGHSRFDQSSFEESSGSEFIPQSSESSSVKEPSRKRPRPDIAQPDITKIPLSKRRKTNILEKFLYKDSQPHVPEEPVMAIAIEELEIPETTPEQKPTNFITAFDSRRNGHSKVDQSSFEESGSEFIPQSSEASPVKAPSRKRPQPDIAQPDITKIPLSKRRKTNILEKLLNKDSQPYIVQPDIAEMPLSKRRKTNILEKFLHKDSQPHISKEPAMAIAIEEPEIPKTTPEQKPTKLIIAFEKYMGTLSESNLPPQERETREENPEQPPSQIATPSYLSATAPSETQHENDSQVPSLPKEPEHDVSASELQDVVMGEVVEAPSHPLPGLRPVFFIMQPLAYMPPLPFFPQVPNPMVADTPPLHPLRLVIGPFTAAYAQQSSAQQGHISPSGEPKK